MGNNETGGVVRAVVAAVVAYAAGKGWITQGVGAEITAALTTLIVSVWSVMAKRAA